MYTPLSYIPMSNDALIYCIITYYIFQCLLYYIYCNTLSYTLMINNMLYRTIIFIYILMFNDAIFILYNQFSHNMIFIL